MSRVFEGKVKRERCGTPGGFGTRRRFECWPSKVGLQRTKTQTSKNRVFVAVICSQTDSTGDPVRQKKGIESRFSHMNSGRVAA